MSPDTIAAQATPAGRGAVGIVRLTGPEATAIAARICGGNLPSARTPALRTLRDHTGKALDDALVLLFEGGRSYTGEDTVEFQCHGAPVVLETLIDTCCAFGARRAEPGEFTRRAYENGRLDLAQAEAVADLIEAGSVAAARAARASLSGVFTRRLEAINAAAMDLRVLMEGAIDFSDEDIDWLAHGNVPDRLEQLFNEVTTLQQEAARGATLAQGLELVIAGPPNSGKSTLLNRLCGDELAIVTNIPGTTRDALTFDLLLDGVTLRVSDTAGLRDTDDPIEREGVRRSRQRIGTADIVLLVRDDTSEQQDNEPDMLSDRRYITVYNKCDLSGRSPGPVAGNAAAVAISARDDLGIDALLTALRRLAGNREIEAPFSARSRHLAALAEASDLLVSAHRRLTEGDGVDIAAADLLAAQNALGSITGATSNEALLGAIFSRFCIGK